jgi:hypothetical protein
MWVCGKARFHGFEPEEFSVEIFKVAGPDRAADGRRRRNYVCGHCNLSFFEEREARSHFGNQHLPSMQWRRHDYEAEHGSWVKEDEKQVGMCGTAAVEPFSRSGPWWRCDVCGYENATRRSVRAHWVRSHISRRTLKPIDHGTDRGYYAHIRRGEPMCDECRSAHTVAQGRRNKEWVRRPAKLYD